jgi:hypothetical protein
VCVCVFEKERAKENDKNEIAKESPLDQHRETWRVKVRGRVYLYVCVRERECVCTRVQEKYTSRCPLTLLLYCKKICRSNARGQSGKYTNYATPTRV